MVSLQTVVLIGCCPLANHVPIALSCLDGRLVVTISFVVVDGTSVFSAGLPTLVTRKQVAFVHIWMTRVIEACSLQLGCEVHTAAHVSGYTSPALTKNPSTL